MAVSFLSEAEAFSPRARILSKDALRTLALNAKFLVLSFLASVDTESRNSRRTVTSKASRALSSTF